jgi:hypothetical protein
MKIKYSFRVSGIFRLSSARHLIVDSKEIKLKFGKKKLLKSFSVTYKVCDTIPLPAIEPSSDPKVALRIVIPESPYRDEAIGLAQRIEANLSTFGIDGVDTQQPKVEWLPENDDERANLRVFAFGPRAGTPVDTYPLWRFGVFKAAAQSANPEESVRSQLAFFRGGSAALRRFRYGEAFLFYFYFLEGLFGDSQIKTRSLQRAFLRSPLMTGAIRQELSFRKSKSLIDNWSSLDERGAVDRLIEVRGFLSHNAGNRRLQWRPNEQSSLAPDANFISNVASVVANKLLWGANLESFPSSPVVKDAYHARYAQFNARNPTGTL